MRRIMNIGALAVVVLVVALAAFAERAVILAPFALLGAAFLQAWGWK